MEYFCFLKFGDTAAISTAPHHLVFSSRPTQGGCAQRLVAGFWKLCSVLHTLPPVCGHWCTEAQFSHRRFSIGNSEKSPDLTVLHGHPFSLNVPSRSCNYEGITSGKWCHQISQQRNNGEMKDCPHQKILEKEEDTKNKLTIALCIPMKK